MDIGQRLKEERVRIGKSQADIATLLGVAKKSQTNYELGHTVPAADYLAAAAGAGIDVMYVLTGVASPAMAGDEGELLRRYRRASREIRAAVLAALGATLVPAPSPPPNVAISGGEQGQVVAGDQHTRTQTINVGGRKKGKR